MVFKRSPSVPKKRPYKKTVQCPTVVLVALNIIVCRSFARVARLLMSANINKHGTERKPCDARQHFIQTNRMTNKT